ncbi:chorismate-binding protein [Mumia sp. zg.B53]|uniref:chorismate-binding protein n=1 Tax=Mumia sp. zg.B53 TaxID=2855449 RepID=UPI001C6F1B82|nr:chorismate-binding protein [Mumia sp. zg.B53]MBW9214798.1 chorismate-binding protein [Mumia sp. zg.B53]
MTTPAADRRRIGPLDLGPLLRRLGGRDRLVALVGAWDSGRALVAYDPVRVLADGDDPFDVGTGPDGAREMGTWIGWWGYQLGARLEDVGPVPPRTDPLPDADLALYETVLRRIDGVWWFESVASPEQTEERWARLCGLLAGDEPQPAAYGLAPFVAVPGIDAHREAVRRTIAHIHAGDVFQANVCLRLESRIDGAGGSAAGLEMFLSGVAALAPAYAAYVAGRSGTIVSLSPELYLRRTGRHLVSSPIKGTAPAEADPADLVASVKDHAENVMIVDLVRNDLGRVAETGTVRVTATTEPRRRAGVWHLVSDVEATLAADATDADLLRATFPPGSVTGAPKVRAMQIIGEQEATGREVYTGAIGHAGPRGLEASVVIRTFEIRGDRVWLGVGGGVVADSDPDAELRECFTKAAPLLRAVGATLQTPAPGGAVHAPRPPIGGLVVPTRLAGPGRPGRPDSAAGIFDTLLVRDGRLVDLDHHLARFVRSARSVYGVGLEHEVLAVRARAAAGPLRGSHRLRLTLDPRTGDVAVTAVPTGAVPSDPWTLCPVVLPGGLGDAKWTDRAVLDTLPGAPWTPARDPLLVDEDGTVLETGRGSVFAVFDDGVHTPSLDGRILPGVTREAVLGLLRGRAVPVVERRIALAELAGASEVFVTSAISRVRPVAEVTGVVRRALGRTTDWIRRLDQDRDDRDRDDRDRDDRGRDGASSPGHRSVAETPGRSASAVGGTRVLLIDNYDSFVHNLAQYVRELGADATVVRNDAFDVEGLARLRRTGGFTHVVISPGPGEPSSAGASIDAVRVLGPTTPILGVCLGHQAIAEAYGAQVVRAPRPVHGVPSLIHHDGQGVYAGLDGPLVAARYHSLVVEDLPEALIPTARNAEGVLMGVRHREHPVEGVQIHPESILTPRGHDLLANFLSRG